ncbi:MAG TPA: VIT1/CCC1 transporter family protein [Candidatus Limnocylindrales bacterium]|nr:VIT1/CCC1 transporter family protein [Candidatus Limnocylindrales bacterium]
MNETALERWREEKASSWVYRIVADAEPDLNHATLFRALAKASDDQAEIIARDIPASDGPPSFRPTPRLKLVAILVRLLGPKRCRPLLAAVKVRGLSVYDRHLLINGHVMPKNVSEVGGRHQSLAGGNLRAAVFGVNDGLVSNACLILGVSGAAPDSSAVVLAGTAGLLAGAFSMAAGEYVSVRSQRELFEYQIGQERDELEMYPEEEAEELALIYGARGVPVDKARELAHVLIKDPQTALDALAREELGLNPDDLGSPIGAAMASFVAFSCGALLPLLPFLPFVAGHVASALRISIAASAVALFGIGATLSLFSGRGAITGGIRMLAIGMCAGAATWGIGRMLGVGLS